MAWPAFERELGERRDALAAFRPLTADDRAYLADLTRTLVAFAELDAFVTAVEHARTMPAALEPAAVPAAIGDTTADAPAAGDPVAGAPVAGARIADAPAAGRPAAGAPVAGIAEAPAAGAAIAGIRDAAVPGRKAPLEPAVAARALEVCLAGSTAFWLAVAFFATWQMRATYEREAAEARDRAEPGPPAGGIAR